MATKRSLRLPITLAIVMAGLLGVLTVGWVILAGFRATSESGDPGLGWTFLALGTSFIGLLLVGVVMYMVLTIKAINLGTRQSNFIDSVTHELKSPIASMKLYLQTMLRHPVTEENRDGFCSMMLEDVDRLDHLINQMLDAGRLEAGRVGGRQKVVDLAAVVAEYADITQKRNRVDPEAFRLELEPCLVQVVPSQLEMVVHNILDNAVKYAGDPPIVWVKVRSEDGKRAILRIADNGRGIPPGDRRKIFRRFVRLGEELEREQPGTGLGLYVANTIVKRMKGRIRVKERLEGPGAVFEVVLPCAEEA